MGKSKGESWVEREEGGEPGRGGVVVVGGGVRESLVPHPATVELYTDGAPSASPPAGPAPADCVRLAGEVRLYTHTRAELKYAQ